MDCLNTELIFGGDFIVPPGFKIQAGKKIKDYFSTVNYRVLNLEGPLLSQTNNYHKIDKTGPNIYSKTKTTINLLEELGINAINLANNHILDYDQRGLENTIKELNKIKVDTIGAGMTRKTAGKPLIKKFNGISFGFISVAENEWANAGHHKAGANPFDLVDNFYAVQHLSKKVDYLIFQYHGGNEHYAYPSPDLQKKLRYFADAGADLIITHHSHCISGYEIYEKTPIFYGLGNFLFPSRNLQNRLWYEGLIVKAKFSKDKAMDFEIAFSNYDSENKRIDLSTEDQLFQRLEDINQVIINPQKVQEEWSNFLYKKREQYLRVLSPIRGVSNRYLRGGMYLMNIHKLLYSKEYHFELLNMIRCEAHVEAIKGILKNKIKNSDKS